MPSSLLISTWSRFGYDDDNGKGNDQTEISTAHKHSHALAHTHIYPAPEKLHRASGRFKRQTLSKFTTNFIIYILWIKIIPSNWHQSFCVPAPPPPAFSGRTGHAINCTVPAELKSNRKKNETKVDTQTRPSPTTRVGIPISFLYDILMFSERTEIGFYYFGLCNSVEWRLSTSSSCSNWQTTAMSIMYEEKNVLLQIGSFFESYTIFSFIVRIVFFCHSLRHNVKQVCVTIWKSSTFLSVFNCSAVRMLESMYCNSIFCLISFCRLMHFGICVRSLCKCLNATGTFRSISYAHRHISSGNSSIYYWALSWVCTMQCDFIVQTFESAANVWDFMRSKIVTHFDDSIRFTFSLRHFSMSLCSNRGKEISPVFLCCFGCRNVVMDFSCQC